MWIHVSERNPQCMTKLWHNQSLPTLTNIHKPTQSTIKIHFCLVAKNLWLVMSKPVMHNHADTHIYAHTCTHELVQQHLHMHTYADTHICTCMHICTYLHICTHAAASTHVSLCVCCLLLVIVWNSRGSLGNLFHLLVNMVHWATLEDLRTLAKD